MPRELVHWRVLDQSLENCPERIAKIISSNKEAAYLGAIAHDSAYYHNKGKSSFVVASKFLHGSFANDTFSPLARLLELSENDKQRAFVFGMFSHAIVDQVFHPLIYYVTGDYYAEDKNARVQNRASHRLFEVYLDSWLREKKAYDLNPSLRQEIQSAAEILSKIEFPDDLPKLDPSLWEPSLKEIVSIRKFLINDFIGLLVRISNIVSFGAIKGIDSLFSFNRRRAPAIFDREFEFRNPVTGKEQTESLENLLSSSKSRLEDLWQDLDGLLDGKPFNKVGTSLNFDEPDTTPSSAKHFSSKKLF